MRKSFHGLALLVHDRMQHDPADGSMYVFWNKSRNKLKILQWDRDGFWLHYKNLAKGKFIIPASENDTSTLTGKNLHYILEGLSTTKISNSELPTKIF